ncbi:pseudouridine synthase [Viridothelium virens]|uniref:tRNA pseudouridine(55) synthase n=1 Tax=Viridothelium virens TaxID=1048519 RepID=A0A6A6HL78_VIRVR|nr:pseudouridine synthase [Viridothelium virens]
MPTIEGVVAINKPPSLSSAGALRKLQEQFNPSKLFAPLIANEESQRVKNFDDQRKRRSRRARQSPKVKLGHGGTLDPLATGVLAVGIGKGTKSLGRFLDCTKGYECVVLFGAATDSYDRVGKVIGRAPYAHINKEQIEQALSKFRGKIMQKPPMFSALKVEGKKMYEYAREGKELPIEIQERPVEVLDLEMVEWLEGGTHSHEIPKTEADGEEKIVANKLLHLDETIDPPLGAEEDDAGDKTQSGAKRSRTKSTEDEFVIDAPAKRVRHSSGSPMMSGALPPEEGTESLRSEEMREQEIKVQNLDEPQENTQPPEHKLDRPSGPPAAKIRMTVTSGFYVRSFCHDLGAAVGSLALMSELVRTRQGAFELGRNVLNYDIFDKGEETWAPEVQSRLEDWSRKSGSIDEVNEDHRDEARRRNSSSEVEDRS